MTHFILDALVSLSKQLDMDLRIGPNFIHLGDWGVFSQQATCLQERLFNAYGVFNRMAGEKGLTRHGDIYLDGELRA